MRNEMFELTFGETASLDEMIDMPVAIQSKLLRALLEGQVRSVDGSRYFQANFRFTIFSNP
jgi:DNA-binding NtrC family response regulator